MGGVFKPDVSGSGGTAASQAQQEAGSAIDVFTSPGRQQYHPSAAKAWVQFNGTGTVTINSSYNVTSVADEGAGLYRTNFTTAFSSANYAVATMVGPESDSGRFSVIGGSSLVAGGFQTRLSNSGDSANVDSARVMLICFGDQS